MTDKEIEHLVALSEKATRGLWSAEGDYLIGYPPGARPNGEGITQYRCAVDLNSGRSEADAKFTAAIVNWFRANHATLKSQNVVAGEVVKRLRELSDASLVMALLRQACEDLIWCGGSADFGPGGQAKIGYDKGPRATIAAINAMLEGKITPEQNVGAGEVVCEILKSFAANLCYACGWPLAGKIEGGCMPFNCSFRPEEQNPQYADWKRRAEEIESVRRQYITAPKGKT